MCRIGIEYKACDLVFLHMGPEFVTFFASYYYHNCSHHHFLCLNSVKNQYRHKNMETV